MSRTYKDSLNSKQNRDRGGRGRKRNISVRAVRRDPPDVQRLSRAVIALATACRLRAGLTSFPGRPP